MTVVTLDEIVGMVRAGCTPKRVASELGVSRTAVRNRFDLAGRLLEYENAVRDTEARLVAAVDVEGLMSLADSGLSLNQACVSMSCPRGLAFRRLEDDHRVVEFVARWRSAVDGVPLPRVDADAYFEGPRVTIVSTIPSMDAYTAEMVAGAVSEIDSMVRDGSCLSRLCGGGSR